VNFHFVDVNIAAIAHEMVSYARRKFAHCWYVSPCPFFSICLLIFFFSFTFYSRRQYRGEVNCSGGPTSSYRVPHRESAGLSCLMTWLINLLQKN